MIFRWNFRHLLWDRRVIVWIVNEADRACAIKADSPSPTMRALARILGTLMCRFLRCLGLRQFAPFSNPSDLPSRGKIREAVSELGLVDCGLLEGDQELVDRVLQLTSDPYQVASRTSGAKN